MANVPSTHGGLQTLTTTSNTGTVPHPIASSASTGSSSGQSKSAGGRSAGFVGVALSGVIMVVGLIAVQML